MLSPDSSAEFASPAFEQLLLDLAARTGGLEAEQAWPQEQFRRLAQTGVLGWVIPVEFGGGEIAADALLHGYEQLAAACLVTTFILTQRNGACQRIAGCENADLKADLLPRLGTGEMFATVGISHLTTSRQHLRQPAVAARETDRGFILDGTVPWVTGATQADIILTGGTLEDGRQILVALPTNRPGVSLHEPERLMALNASQTGAVSLTEVEVERRFLVAGPVPQVMKTTHGGGAGSLTTSVLALGAARGTLQRLCAEAERRPDLTSICDQIADERQRILRDLFTIAHGSGVHTGHTAETIRQRANSLVTRTAQAYLAAAKGAGYVAGHPAERAVREAMFFLVWSCPQPVLNAALQELACGLG